MSIFLSCCLTMLSDYFFIWFYWSLLDSKIFIVGLFRQIFVLFFFFCTITIPLVSWQDFCFSKLVLSHLCTGPVPECTSAPAGEQHGYQLPSSLLPPKFVLLIWTPVHGHFFWWRPVSQDHGHQDSKPLCHRTWDICQTMSKWIYVNTTLWKSICPLPKF